MRLVAIYVKEHEYLINEPTTINFGGEHLYAFEEKKGTILISRSKNHNHIEGFFDLTSYDCKLSLISAVVGKNGAGKSSIMDIIRSKFVKNEFSLPNSKTILLIESEEDEYPIILQSDFKNIVYKLSTLESEKLKAGEELTKKLNKYTTSDAQTIYYSPHFDFKYNLNFDEIDDYDLSFDKILEEDLKDLENKGTSSNGWNYTPTQELVFKNSLRQLMFFSSDLVKKNNIFKNIFNLPEHGQSKLFFRGHKIEREWNTPSSFRPALKIIKEKLKKESSEWGNIRKFSKDKKKVLNQIDVNKYLLKRNLIKDIISVLERQMEKENSYLSNGEINFVKFDKQTKNLDAYDSFLLFINTSKIKFGSSKFDAFHSKSIKELFNKLYKYIEEIDREDFVENDNIQIEPLKIFELLKLHKEFLQNLFAYYPKLQRNKNEEPLYEKSNKIEGFINYIPTNKSLSSGENALLNLFSRIYTFIDENLSEKTKILPAKKHYILLLDEADLAFHPTWKKKFVKSIVSSLPYFFEGLKNPPSLQIIFTSHDPLTLSDIPKENIVYLNKDEDGKMIIVNSSTKKSFGANITDLLADSFFVEGGLIGEFAKLKIEKTIKWLNENKDPANRNVSFSEQFEHHKKIIAMIDEPIISLKLSEMLDELVEDKEFQKEMLQKEIDYLTKRKNSLDIPRS
ncbi:hypothetical protein EC396_10515 [Lutibacter sp. HS1-25]|uniref:ATP-binding protein n=1 Tax=Lutibacter sp. HS1-25 TaxID=2485000 RepID=UPI001012C806|nr:ATP-binding protein [Lutibacter sp. HS1-25]RXP53130.1 hypothetical protein EC396_10515 [Lutibacter sp. HS1-25]